MNYDVKVKDKMAQNQTRELDKCGFTACSSPASSALNPI
jgi:hypothetical protein